MNIIPVAGRMGLIQEKSFCMPGADVQELFPVGRIYKICALLREKRIWYNRTVAAVLFLYIKAEANGGQAWTEKR